MSNIFTLNFRFIEIFRFANNTVDYGNCSATEKTPTRKKDSEVTTVQCLASNERL